MNLKDQRQIVALILIGVGVLWLLVSFGIVAEAFIRVLARYWPVLLIGVGVDILVRRRPLWGLPYTALAFGALLVFSFFGSMSGVAGGNRLERSLSEPLGAAREAEIRLELSSAPVSVSAGAGDELLRADIRDPGDVRLEARGDTSKTLRLERRSGRPRLGSDTRWDVALTERIPLDLEVSSGSGPLELDLTGLNLSALALDLGSSSSDIILPTTGNYELTLDSGSGSSDITVPEGAQLSAEVDLGSGATHFDIGKNSYVTLTLDSGSGPVTVDTPDGANIKVEVQDGGSGRLELPDWLKRVDGGRDDEGVWQTEGFDPDGAQIVVVVEDAGSGPLTVR